MLLLQNKFKFSPDREKGQLLQPMLLAMAVALRRSDNTKPIILAFFLHVYFDLFVDHQYCRCDDVDDEADDGDQVRCHPHWAECHQPIPISEERFQVRLT